jgi:hypothetical protein
VPVGNTSYTIFAVWQSANVEGPILFAGEFADNKALYFDCFVDGKIRQEWYNNDFSAQVMTLNAPHIVTLQYDGSTRLTRLDTDEMTEASGGKNTSSTPMTIGIDPAYALTGFIAELIIYHTALSGADIVKNENYLKTKWGL